MTESVKRHSQLSVKIASNISFVRRIFFLTGSVGVLAAILIFKFYSREIAIWCLGAILCIAIIVMSTRRLVPGTVDEYGFARQRVEDIPMINHSELSWHNNLAVWILLAGEALAFLFLGSLLTATAMGLIEIGVKK